MNLATKLVCGEDIRAGMHIQTWFGMQQIARIDPYTGPHDFVIGVMRFSSGHGMSIASGDMFDVVVVEEKQ